MRNFKIVAVAVACAIGFWAVLLNNPPKSVASGPTTAAFSPSDIKIPLDLPTLTGADPI